MIMAQQAAALLVATRQAPDMVVRLDTALRLVARPT